MSKFSDVIPGTGLVRPASTQAPTAVAFRQPTTTPVAPTAPPQTSSAAPSVVIVPGSSGPVAPAPKNEEPPAKPPVKAGMPTKKILIGAGLLILAINIFGGLIIGMAQHGLSFDVAARTYITLTVGDGLVAQVPSLLLSIATAVIVTRSSGGQDLSEQLRQQIGRAHV